MGVFYEFDDVERFAVGALGRPGSRVFFIQVRGDAGDVTVKCEKQQAAAISQYLRKVLNDLPPPESRPVDSSFDTAVFDDPEFVLGPIGLGYDQSNDRILIQLEELGEIDEEGDPVDDPDRGHVRCFLSRDQAQAFCDHADVVVSAGRPDCRMESEECCNCSALTAASLPPPRESSAREE